MNQAKDQSVPAPNWLVRAYHTPVSDALRGNLSGRLDVRRQVAAAGLPAPLIDLVNEVVRRTRLWRGEKIDVARELTSHFADGLAAGRSAEQLARDFGTARQAAGLIRAAKRRNRPLIWHAWRTATRAVLAAIVVSVVVYVWLAARFYLGQPNIARNYWHEINAARRLPDADRAWPLYRQALVRLGRQDAALADTDRVALGPAGKHWAESVAMLERQKDVLDMVRAAAKRPRLGFYFGDASDLGPARKTADWIASGNMPLADQNQELVSVNLDGAQHCRMLARLLAMDAHVAAVEGQGGRVVDDLTAMIGLAEQLIEPDAALVEQLIGIAIFGFAMDRTGRIMADTPAVLSDGQLQALAHRIAAYRDGNPSLDLSEERMFFDDVMQRAYTDNGRGDGRITPAGISMLVEYAGASPAFLKLCDPKRATDRRELLASRLISPAAAALVGGRLENSQLYHDLLDEMIALHQGDAWRWDAKAIEACEDRIKKAAEPGRNRFRYYWVDLMLPGVSAVFSAGQRTIQVRDAAEIVIALELWHRRHGAWPERLEQLVPELLPAVPPDRLDGQPLRYTLRDGKPILYSIGKDRRDDGGTPNAEDPDNCLPGSFSPVSPGWEPDASSLGDWIIWPPAPEKIEETDS